jgi:hypothetical protein
MRKKDGKEQKRFAEKQPDKSQMKILTEEKKNERKRGSNNWP